MENITNFLTSATKYGVVVTDLFQTVDLFQASNIPAVTQGIMALASLVSFIKYTKYCKIISLQIK